MEKKIKNVTVLGAGNLGSQIAFQIAYHGIGVILYDVNFEAFGKAMEFFPLLREMYIKYLDVLPEDLDNTLNNITFSDNLQEAVSDADLVIESVPENMEIKKEVYSQLASFAPEKTIFATNSSTFLPTALMSFTGRPDRFIALHFANMLSRFNIAEIMGCVKTAPEVYAQMVEFAEEIGMVPIEIKKENSGYVLNALLIPLLTAASQLFVKGVADIETIDKTWRVSTGAPAGPFEIFDVIGLNTIHNIAKNGGLNSQYFVRFLEEQYINKGKMGFFSGEGFYKY
ncbi:MAG: 3-hydroxyacyl-CoA dehydrogenase [Dysgonomonas sp.]|nr:3-hydroxyacyl-CoA dehydrogenase [Dysgonomonas sp.]